MRRRASDNPTFLGLPVPARAYVVAVVVAGAGCLVAAALRLHLDHAGLFVTLLGLAVAASAAKIELPLGRSQSNLSLSHAVNFWALFALGPAPTACIAAVSAWAQCTLRAGARNPPHRVVFSIASLIVTVSIAGLPLGLIMGADASSVAALARAAAIVAPLYFFVNTALVAGAIALSTRQPVARIWQRNFLWSAPSYLAGAALAAVATATWERGWFGWLALLAMPLYLVFRSYHTVVARLREEQDETLRAMDVQLATIEALALAIEAKAGCTPEHIRSIQQYAVTLAEGGRPLRQGRAGGAHGGIAARRRQHGRPRAHSLEARRAHARGVRARQDSSPRGRRDSAQRAVRRAGRRARALPSRAMGRPGLSGGPARARTFRSARASSRSRTATAPCRPTARTGPAAARTRRSPCSASTRASRSIRSWWSC